LELLNQLTEVSYRVEHNETNTRTKNITCNSQSLRVSLKSRRKSWQTNDELQDKALLLVKQKDEVEAKNKEVEEARKSLEKKPNSLRLLLNINLNSSQNES